MIGQATSESRYTVHLISSGTVMGSSFVVFYVSMEITLGHFRSRESGYTQKRPCQWINAIYPWIKGLV